MVIQRKQIVRLAIKKPYNKNSYKVFLLNNDDYQATQLLKKLLKVSTLKPTTPVPDSTT